MIGEAARGEILHHKVGAALIDPRVVHADDVIVFQPGEQMPLAFESQAKSLGLE